jgi:hypothetical protein
MYYDIYNFLLEDYENCRIYGISFDSNVSMKKWVDFRKEHNESNFFKKYFKNIVNKKKKHNIVFKSLKDIENINIKLSPYVGKINMSSLTIHQNILRNAIGMTFNAFARNY